MISTTRVSTGESIFDSIRTLAAVLDTSSCLHLQTQFARREGLSRPTITAVMMRAPNHKLCNVHTDPAAAGFVVCSDSHEGGRGVRFRPILLKNSIGVFPATILGVSNHHPMNLRGSKRVLEGQLFEDTRLPYCK